MLSPEIIQNLKEDHAFKVFQAHILDKMDELDSIRDFKDMSTQEAGEQVRANSTAYNVLVEILSPVISFQKKREPSKEQIQQKKDEVGL